VATRKPRNVMLAESWDERIDPKGWLMSEKFNGWRTEFDGKVLKSASGQIIDAPADLVRSLPPIPLDGELWLGRGQGHLQDIGSIVAHASDPRWARLYYVVFDLPDEKAGPFSERLRIIQYALRSPPPRVAVIPYVECKSRQHWDEFFQGVVEENGEGAMLRRPASRYVRRRSSDLLKRKKFFDDVAEVIGYEPGKNGCVGMMGALKCRLENGIEFKIGTGFTNDQRRKALTLFPLHSWVEFSYPELSKEGKPIGSPSFQRVRPDE
jgi:DNA ligase-1